MQQQQSGQREGQMNEYISIQSFREMVQISGADIHATQSLPK